MRSKTQRSPGNDFPIALGKWLLLPVVATSVSFSSAMSRDLESETSKIQQQLANQTYVHFEAFHGTQVSYLRADGTEFLWYPGNTVVLRAKWRIDATNEQAPSICYQYGTDTYNPATKQIGGQWECRRISDSFRNKVDSSTGDVFALANRESVPYILPREQATIDSLKKPLLKQ